MLCSLDTHYTVCVFFFFFFRSFGFAEFCNTHEITHLLLLRKGIVKCKLCHLNHCCCISYLHTLCYDLLLWCSLCLFSLFARPSSSVVLTHPSVARCGPFFCITTAMTPLLRRGRPGGCKNAPTIMTFSRGGGDNAQKEDYFKFDLTGEAIYF